LIIIKKQNKMNNFKNHKVYQALVKKANGKGRMPSLKQIAKLLSYCKVEHYLQEWSETKWRENGLRYNTSGGGTYYGYRLSVPELNLRMESTDTYYSYNTGHYTYELLNLLNNLNN